MTLNKGLIALPSITSSEVPEDLAMSGCKLEPKKIKTTELVVYLPVHNSALNKEQATITNIKQAYGLSDVAIALIAAYEIPMLTKLTLGFECVYVAGKSLPVIQGHFVLDLNDTRTVDDCSSEILAWYVDSVQSITQRLIATLPCHPPTLG